MYILACLSLVLSLSLLRAHALYTRAWTCVYRISTGRGYCWCTGVHTDIHGVHIHVHIHVRMCGRGSQGEPGTVGGVCVRTCMHVDARVRMLVPANMCTHTRSYHPRMPDSPLLYLSTPPPRLSPSLSKKNSNTIMEEDIMCISVDRTNQLCVCVCSVCVCVCVCGL